MSKEKIIGQLKLRLNGVFEPFNLYGQHVLIPPAIEAVVHHALQMHEDLKKEGDKDGDSICSSLT